MKLFAVYGFSKSGKTTTVVEIIKELKARGYSVSTIKDVHLTDFTLDTAGKDSWRHWKAGADAVGLRTRNESTIMIKKPMGLLELIQYFSTDFLVLEGFREADVPKILCAKDESQVREDLQDSVFCISGIIATQLSSYFDLPVINVLTDVTSIVDLIETHSCGIRKVGK